MKRLLLPILFFIFASCSHSVHLVNMSDHSLDKSMKNAKKIEVESKQHVIFWFAFDSNYVEEAKTKLIRKCRNGEIKNITTRYSTSHGFFNWYNKIHMQGYCFKS